MVELVIVIAVILAGFAYASWHAYRAGYNKGKRDGFREGLARAGPQPPLHGFCRSELDPYVQGHQPKVDTPLDPTKVKPPPGGSSARRPKWRE